MENNYKLVEDLNYGSVIRLSFRDAEVENDETGETTREMITRDCIITNVGPVICEGEPEKVFLTDLDDGTLMMIEKGVEVLVIKQA